MTTRIKLRRDTAANWADANPVLALGEPGYDTTNNELRIGDGTTAWSDLTGAVGGGLSGSTITNGVYDTLQNGLPVWMRWQDRGEYVQDVNYGADRNGVWFAGSEDVQGNTYALPLQSVISLPSDMPSTVRVEFKYTGEQDNDHIIGFHLANTVPRVTWDGEVGGFDHQVFLQINEG